RAASATLKSTTTSAPASSRDDSSPVIARSPSGPPPPAGRPAIAGVPAAAGSTAPTTSRSAAPATARHTSCPIRPPAPTTPTLIMAAPYAVPPPLAPSDTAPASDRGRRRRFRRRTTATTPTATKPARPAAEPARPALSPGGRYRKVRVHRPAGTRTPWSSPTCRTASSRGWPPVAGTACTRQPGMYASLRTTVTGPAAVTRSTVVPQSVAVTWVADDPAGDPATQTGGRTVVRTNRPYSVQFPAYRQPACPRACCSTPSRAHCPPVAPSTTDASDTDDAAPVTTNPAAAWEVANRTDQPDAVVRTVSVGHTVRPVGPTTPTRRSAERPPPGAAGPAAGPVPDPVFPSARIKEAPDRSTD